jgi:hypothetical protein
MMILVKTLSGTKQGKNHCTTGSKVENIYALHWLSHFANRCIMQYTPFASVARNRRDPDVNAANLHKKKQASGQTIVELIQEKTFRF